MTIQKTKLLKRELAELLGCLPIVVSRLVKKGEVKVGIDGKIDISSPEMKEYIKNKRIEIEKHKERIRKKDSKRLIEKTNILNYDNNQELQHQNNNIADEETKQTEKNKQIESTEEYKELEKYEKNIQDLKSINQDKSFTNIEYETKQHKLESERYKAQLLEMEVKQRKKDLVNTEILNRIITKTIGNLTKNIVEIPINIVDEIIDIVKSEEEPKPLIINLITKNLHKEIESTIDKTEKEFLNL